MNPAISTRSRRSHLRSWLALVLPGMLFALACGGADTPGPAITHFEVVPASVDVGESVALKMAFSGGEGRVEPMGRLVHSGFDVPLEASSSTEYTLTVTAPSGAAATAKTTLAVKPGLLVKVEGLPQGLGGAVTVTGPNGFARSLTQTEALKGLQPGRYVVSAATVQEGSTARYPLCLRQEVELTTTGALVRVRYPAPTLTFNLPGEVPLEFVLIPPGSFMMGAVHPEQTDGWVVYPGPTTALPRHEVTFAKAFYLGKFPVTTRQWKAVTGWTTPDYATKDPDVAVWNRDWFEWHLEFLPALKGLVPNHEFRLPSEAEWEYALRAGSTTRYFWGDDFNQIDTYCWTAETTHAVGNLWPKVGLKQPNAWGLHDMFTMFQYVEDDAHPDYAGAPSNGNPWLDSPRPIWRTMRGGSWGLNKDNYKDAFQSAARIFDVQPSMGEGLRLALTISE